MIRSDLHTHSVFSDGKSTIEAMVCAAVAKGLTSIGISDHSFTPFDLRYCMREEQIPQYLAELRRVKEKYNGRIEVYAGLECDGFSELSDRDGFDYIIGDCHYIKTQDGYHSVDHAAPEQWQVIQDHFHGDPIAYARAYFETYVACTRRHRPDILGHFDLLTKFGFIPENDPAYRDMATEALLACLAVTPVVEVNAGAIARGLRSSPYPAPFLLREIRTHGGRVLLSSDAHSAENIAFWFDEAKSVLHNAGFNSTVILRNGVLEDTAL